MLRAAVVGAALTSVLAGAAAVALPMVPAHHALGTRVVAADIAPGARPAPTFMPADDLPVATAGDAPSTTSAPKTVTPATRPAAVVKQTAAKPAKPATKPAAKTKSAPAVNVVIPTGPLVGRANGADIEGYAQYEPQTTCDPTDKPGAVALRTLLTGYYKGTANYGISRACGTDRSEHYEGRAFDWGANVDNPSQKAAADNFIAQLMATDSYGHKQALARRMGIMYVIWNHQIWSPGPDSTWRPYTGTNPHTDHVHISLSWAGARAETSFWSGTVVPGLPGDDQFNHGGGGHGGGYDWPATGGDDTSTPTTAPSPNGRSHPPRSTTTSSTSTTTVWHASTTVPHTTSTTTPPSQQPGGGQVGAGP